MLIVRINGTIKLVDLIGECYKDGSLIVQGCDSTHQKYTVRVENHFSIASPQYRLNYKRKFY